MSTPSQTGARHSGRVDTLRSLKSFKKDSADFKSCISLFSFLRIYEGDGEQISCSNLKKARKGKERSHSIKQHGIKKKKFTINYLKLKDKVIK